MIKKRGISPVIATVFIVMMTVAAASIIYAIVIPFVKNNLVKSSECVPYSDYYKFDTSFGFNCYQRKPSGDIIYGVSVKANTANNLPENVAGFALRFMTKEGIAKRVNVKEGGNASTEGGKVWLLNESANPKGINPILQIPKRGEIKPYAYNSTESGIFGSVEIYPILKSERICEKTDSVNIVECAENIPKMS